MGNISNAELLATNDKLMHYIVDTFQLIFTILCALFLLIIIRPLYKFSKKRTALYILFSKVFLI